MAKKISTPTEAITRAADAAKILLPSSIPAAPSNALAVLQAGEHLVGHIPVRPLGIPVYQGQGKHDAVPRLQRIDRMPVPPMVSITIPSCSFPCRLASPTSFTYSTRLKSLELSRNTFLWM